MEQWLLKIHSHHCSAEMIVATLPLPLSVAQWLCWPGLGQCAYNSNAETPNAKLVKTLVSTLLNSLLDYPLAWVHFNRIYRCISHNSHNIMLGYILCWLVAISKNIRFVFTAQLYDSPIIF